MRIAVLLLASLPIAHAEEMGIVRKLSENKFAATPGLPSCIPGAVQSGDPSKGPSVIAFKATAGCVVPWHWHTPTEQLMIVSGSAKLQMKNGRTETLGPGDFALMPSKHVHQFTCVSACTGFVHSDAAFDIHYVDANGKEIPPATAPRKKKS
jgi:quercetin dioxygenase-like cupin family protein